MKFSADNISREDVENPEILTQRLNFLIDELREIFTRISVVDNLQAQYHEQQIIGGNAPYFIRPTFAGRVKGVFVAQITKADGGPLASYPTDGVELSWVHDGATVKITEITGIASGTKYFMRFLLLGE